MKMLLARTGVLHIKLVCVMRQTVDAADIQGHARANMMPALLGTPAHRF